VSGRWFIPDNRLSEDLSVRLPSGQAYVAAVEKEDVVLRFRNDVPDHGGRTQSESSAGAWSGSGKTGWSVG
jgi:hypothetical protein